MASTRWIAVQNATSGQYLCQHGRVVNTFFARMRGLLGVSGLGHDAGLLIHPSSAVHTVGMAFAIDVIALDEGGCVVGLRENLRPGSLVFFGWQTREVLELPVGQIELASVRLGHRLLVTTSEPPALHALPCFSSPASFSPATLSPSQSSPSQSSPATRPMTTA